MHSEHPLLMSIWLKNFLITSNEMRNGEMPEEEISDCIECWRYLASELHFWADVVDRNIENAEKRLYQKRLL